MASAAPSPLAGSTETTNGTKLRRLLVDGGGLVLRKIFDGYHPPGKLAADLHSHCSTLDDLFARRILSNDQKQLLFPPDRSNPNSKNFDISLLFLLLTEICGLSPPHKTWSNKPHAKNKSEAANIVRIKLFRNKLLHTPETRIDTRVFTQLWKEISGVLVSLGLSQAEINRLEAEPCREDYIDILFKWADREKDMKLKLDEVHQDQKKTHQTLEKVCETQRDQQVLLQDTKEAVQTVSQTQQEQQVLLQDTKGAVQTVSQTQQEQQVLLQDTKEAVQTVSQTQQEQQVLLQDTKGAVQTVSQTQQEQQVLLQDTKGAVQTVSQTQQKQQVLLQDTKEAVQTVSQTQQEQQILLQDTKEAVRTVSQTQQEQQVLLQDANKNLQTCLNQQVSKSEMETIQVDLQEIKQSMSSLKEEQKREREEETLQSLAKCDFKADIQCYVGRFQEGTREWVFNKVENWLNDKKSQNRVMVICGNAGMGKSVISAVVCQRMLEAGRLSGCHFIQHNNVRYRKPQLMLQSLAYQMCCVHPEFKLALVDQLRRNTGNDHNDMGVEELFALLFKEPLSSVADRSKEPLSNVVDRDKNMLIVIDGLDESDYQERNELLDVIANHFSKLPPWIRFLVTSRPERNITEALKHLRPFQLESNEEQNMNDIKCFIGKRVKCIPDNIVEKLAEKSEGLMLYAYFLLLYIEENPSVLKQGDVEGSLPLGISSVYSSYFKRLENELRTELGIKEDNVLNLLSTVAASREPLPIDFVSQVLVAGTNSMAPRRKVLKAIRSVSSLLPVRGDRLHVFHKSVKDWLTDECCYGEHDFVVDEKEGHRILAELCTDELDIIIQRGVSKGVNCHSV